MEGVEAEVVVTNRYHHTQEAVDQDIAGILVHHKEIEVEVVEALVHRKETEDEVVEILVDHEEAVDAAAEPLSRSRSSGKFMSRPF